MPRRNMVFISKREPRKVSNLNGESVSLWLDLLRSAPPLLWLILASVVLFQVGPDIWRLVRAGAVTRIGIGAINLELAQKRLAEVRGLNEAGILPAVQEQLKRRFANIADYANEAQILWVDDHHPQKNIRERRVLSTLAIPIDLARSTGEAMHWLADADYDIVITDLTRPDDKDGPCDDPNVRRAGCDLIKQIQMRPNPPTIIVYAGQTEGVISSREKLLVTNNPGNLLHAVIDSIERMDRKH